MSEKKRFVIIEGMHRSGTSFLARALNLAGVYLGGLESLTSHEWNPLEDNLKGHWENKKILALSEKTLSSNKRNWANIPKKISISEQLGTEIKNTLYELETHSSLAWGFKDSRICLCLDSWAHYIPKNFIIVGIFRNPLKVAESLKKRNNFDYEKSLNLWKDHNQKLLYHLEKHNGFLIDFDWPKEKMLSEIKMIIEKLGLDKDMDLSEWYSEELFHSDKSHNPNYPLSDEIQSLYSKLKIKSNSNKKVRIKNIPYTSKRHSLIIQNRLNDIQNQGRYFKKFAEQKDKKILDLQEKLDEGVSWAKNLDEQVKQKDKKILDLQEKLDEGVSWAKNLDEQVKQKDKKILDLQEKLDEGVSWAKNLDEQVKQKDKKILDLQEKLDEGVSWAKNLDEQVKQKGKKILDLQEKLDEGVSWAKNLDEQVKQKGKKILDLQEKLDEGVSWAKNLDEQVKQKGKKILDLQEKLDEGVSWAKNLDEQVKQKGKKILDLQEKLDEGVSWAKNLDEQVKQKGKKILDLQEKLDEGVSWAKNLDEQVKQKGKKILDLQEKIKKTNSILQNNIQKLNELENRIETQNSEIDDLQSKYYDVNYELETIKRSIIYSYFQKMTKGIDKLFPPATKRREFLRTMRMAYLTNKNEGFYVVVSASKQKFGNKKIRKNQKKLPKSLPPFLETEIKNFAIEPQNVDFKNDQSLRDFLQFNAGNILPTSKHPKISIIILTYDQVELLKKNIDSIKSRTTYKNFEIVVVTNNIDQNSDMRKFLNTSDCQVHVYEDEYSFSKMNNFGASKADGEFLLFLNDDVEIQSPNWLEAFLHLGLNKSVGVIGPKLLFPDGRLQEAGCIVWKRGNAWNYGRSGNPDDPDYNYVRDVDYCSGACLFVKKEIFDKIGGFDPRYNPAYSEDVELCFSVKKLGYRVLYQPLANIIHYEGATQGTNVKTGIKSYQLLNQKKFFKKWQHELDSHLEDSQENTFFERDRQNGINILFIDHYVPEPDKDSGSLRTFSILSILRYLGNRVTLWPENMVRTEPYASELQQKGIEVLYGPQNFSKFLDSRKEFYDLVILSRPYVAVKFIDIIKSKMSNCQIIYDTTDLHFLRMKRQEIFNKNQVSNEEVEKMHDMELSLMKKSNLTILTSKEEAKILHSEDESLKFVIISNINQISKKVPNFGHRHDFMFLGGFQHPPNVDSVEYLVNEIFPQIKQKLPQTKLYVIGSNPPEKITNLASKDVIITGFVRDLDPYYDKCRLMLSPIRFGAGIKGKITQSLGKGLPVITNGMGAEGIDLIDGKNCMIADDKTDFANKTIQVYENKELWEKLSKNGLKTAKNYSPELTLELLNSILPKK